MSTYTFFARPRMSVLCDRPMGLRPYVGREPSNVHISSCTRPRNEACTERGPYVLWATYIPSNPCSMLLSDASVANLEGVGGGGFIPTPLRPTVQCSNLSRENSTFLKQNNQDEYQHRCCCCFFQEESTLKAKGKACVQAFCATVFVCK